MGELEIHSSDKGFGVTLDATDVITVLLMIESVKCAGTITVLIYLDEHR